MQVKKNISQFLRYVVVGGLATIVEWAAFYALNTCLSMHYMFATGIAFAISTFANWLFGRLLLFGAQIIPDRALLRELLKIYLTSIAGFLMNLLIMWIAVEKFALAEMLAKIIATGCVFFWNFVVRVRFIYKT